MRPLIAFLVFSSALPTLASAQRDTASDTSRITLFTGGGFGGNDTLTAHDLPIVGTRSTSGSLDATPMVGVRFESPLQRFVLLGAQFRSAFWRDAGANNTSRNPLLDFDVTAKGRYALRVGKIVLEPYVLVPFGVSVAIWSNQNTPSSSTGLSKTNPGWNIGGFGGITVLTRSGFGGMFELGVMHHAGYDKDGNGDHYSLTLTQFTLQAGVTYAF